MERPLWSEDYSVGLEKLDLQHRAIFRLIEELEYLVANNRGRSASAKILMSEIANYAMTHFETEERILEALHYSKIDEHKQSHARYIEFVGEAMAVALGDTDNCSGVLAYLKQWWTRHILAEDMMYKSLVSPHRPFN